MENKNNGFGIASMIIGILALLLACCYGGFLGIIGLILGIIGIVKYPAKKGTAIAGIVTSTISILILIFTLLFVGSLSLPTIIEYMETAQDAQDSSDDTDSQGISLEEYNQIQTGMSYQEIVDIIGCEGRLQSESDENGTVSKMYFWSGENGISTASFIFENDSLESKSQFGLD